MHARRTTMTAQLPLAPSLGAPALPHDDAGSTLALVVSVLAATLGLLLAWLLKTRLDRLARRDCSTPGRLPRIKVAARVGYWHWLCHRRALAIQYMGAPLPSKLPGSRRRISRTPLATAEGLATTRVGGSTQQLPSTPRCGCLAKLSYPKASQRSAPRSGFARIAHWLGWPPGRTMNTIRSEAPRFGQQRLSRVRPSSCSPPPQKALAAPTSMVWDFVASAST